MAPDKRERIFRGRLPESQGAKERPPGMWCPYQPKQFGVTMPTVGGAWHADEETVIVTRRRAPVQASDGCREPIG